MSASRVLVTGASGFIGANLVRHLVSKGEKVTCFVRSSSNVSELISLDCSLIFGDVVEEPAALFDSMHQFDFVYHLAASTHAVLSCDLVRINSTGMKNLLRACESARTPPVLVYVSSISAAGPSKGTRPLAEDEQPRPVSYYGQSKVACETLAREFSGRVPISIIRPPIVLGDGDHNGLGLFRLIDEWGWHFIPGFFTRMFSVIHVADLATAMIGVAERGKRLNTGADSQGLYFVASDQTVSFAELGRMAGRALGRSHTRILPVAKPVMWIAAGINESIARLKSKPQFMNMDKFREAFAGSWVCSNKKIKDETGFYLPVPLQDRMEQTVDWYRSHGWLGPARNVSTQGSAAMAAGQQRQR